jgi:hypothetical protein
MVAMVKCGAARIAPVAFRGALIVVLLLGGLAGADAQFRFDVSLDAPIRISNAPDAFIPPLPLVQAGYQLIAGNLRAGLGLYGVLVILADAFWPGIFLEYELGPLVLRADFGGGIVYVYTRFDGGATESYLIPQLDVSFKLKSWIRLGVGAIAIMQPGGAVEGYAGYAGVRFVLSGSERSPRR